MQHVYRVRRFNTNRNHNRQAAAWCCFERQRLGHVGDLPQREANAARIEFREPSIATFELESQDVAIEGDSALDVGNEVATSVRLRKASRLIASL